MRSSSIGGKMPMTRVRKVYFLIRLKPISEFIFKLNTGSMKKRQFQFIVFSFVLFCSQMSFAQRDGSVLKFGELNFGNDAERTAFESFNKNGAESSVFDLLFVAQDKEFKAGKKSAEQRLDACVNHLKTELEGKSEIKKVKIVFDYVHREFLKVYKLRNDFVSLFALGEYNCVSASALYALVFDRLNIPYQIQETPQHVYLVAYPKTSKILVETTAPTKGYYQFSNSFMTKYINSLYDSKLISKDEIDAAPLTDLFNKYYFKNDGISLLDLAALQFSNFGIYLLDDDNLKPAGDEIKKAYYLSATERHRLLMREILGRSIDKYGYDDTTNLSNLLVLARYNNLPGKEITNDDVLREFGKFKAVALIKNSDYTNYGQFYKRLSNAVNDSALKSNLGFEYYYELARLGFLNTKGEEYELTQLAGAYQFNKMNADLRALIVAVYTGLVDKYNDSQSIMALSDKFLAHFDFLAENVTFLSVKASCLLDLAYQNYYLNQVKTADQYIADFENLAGQVEGVNAGASFVERAYSQGASYYFRTGNKAKAKKMVTTGLKYAPNSFGLKQRLQQLQ